MNKNFVLLSSMLLLSSVAHAELVIDGAPQQPPPSSSQSKTLASPTPQAMSASKTVSASKTIPAAQFSNVTETGPRPPSFAAAGWGHGLPMSLALRQLVPADFSLQQNSVALDKPASWGAANSAGATLTWMDAVNDLARQGHFMVNINWSRKEVSLAPTASLPTFSPPTHAVAKQPEPAVDQGQNFDMSEVGEDSVKAPAKSTASLSTASLSTASVMTPPAPVVPAISSQRWTLDSSLTLRENVEAWGQKAGWHVVWDASDYVVVAPATFQGDFASADGPLAKIMQAYEQADQPLVANLTTMDKVVHVHNKYQQNQEVVPSSPSMIAPQVFDMSKSH